jgi:hypothetical protein
MVVTGRRLRLSPREQAEGYVLALRGLVKRLQDAG